MNKILIVDSGMKNLSGHNFSYTRAVQDALAEKGFATDVLVNKMLSPELAQSSGYQPIFTYGAYDFPPPAGIIQDIKHIYAQASVYCRELEQFFENKLSDYAAVFCHTIADFELIGWDKFLSRNKLNSHLLLLSRTTSNFSQISFFKRNFHPFHRIKPHYLNAIYAKMKGNFSLLTDNEPLTDDFTVIFKHGVITFPIPINKYFLAKEEVYASSLNEFKRRFGINEEMGLCIGYMGDARESKGFYLLPELIRNVLDKTENVYFAIQCPKIANGAESSALPQGVAELNEMEKTTSGRIKLISERLTEEDYANMFRCLDVALIPYPLPGYTKATSGIFAEAVALGIPSIVTENTWMAHELRKFGGGLEVRSNNVEDLTNKVFELIEHYEDFANKARNYSKKWCQFHNSHTLAEMLIQEIKK
jgi:glycosyltransferase involved in cell wall biosynthesis